MKTNALIILSIIVLGTLAVEKLNAQVPNVWYVDGDYTGTTETGESWDEPFKTIEQALTAAQEDEIPREQIWIKASETPYIPTNATTGYSLKPTVHVYGGFFGDEDPVADFENNDPRTFNPDGTLFYQTILSGEIGTPNDHTDNVQIIVTAPANDEDYILDGFVITRSRGHNIHVPGPGSNGTFRNLTITDARSVGFLGTGAGSGAGMFVSFSSPTLLNCVFAENYLDDPNSQGGGGAGLAMIDSNSTIDGCTFDSNTTLSTGGVIVGGGGAWSLHQTQYLSCTFRRNRVIDIDGDPFVPDDDTPTRTGAISVHLFN